MSKNKNAKKNALRGPEGFETYYSEHFCERWPQLKEALLNESRYISWRPFQAVLENTALNAYYMDAGSVLAAFALPLPSCDDNSGTILKCADFCAAPGGKSLVLAARLSVLDNWHLTCNERSNQRRLRLSRNIQDQLPDDVQKKIKVTGFDAARWCRYETETFDRIFVDAPCSSERHVLSDPTYLNQWSPARIKNLAQTQWSILSSAFRVLKHGGFLVYATCALSPLENDGVIARLLKKFTDASIYPISTDEIKKSITDNSKLLCGYITELPDTENTEYGFHVLPDRQLNAGPLFFSIIKKK